MRPMAGSPACQAALPHVLSALRAGRPEAAALRTGGAEAAEAASDEPVETAASAERAASAEPAADGTDAEVDPTIAEAEATAPGAPEGARVLALKMALDGTPRDETARYLRENFELEDPEALLDEVYARVGG